MASARGRFFTHTGAIMMFSNTVMCGNRLKRWNTIPTLSRILFRSVLIVDGEAVDLDPPPESVSSALMQRRKVLLPEPEGPMTHTTSLAAIRQEMPRSTWLSPNCFAGYVRESLLPNLFSMCCTNSESRKVMTQ